MRDEKPTPEARILLNIDVHIICVDSSHHEYTSKIVKILMSNYLCPSYHVCTTYLMLWLQEYFCLS
jgi:hypothetical protein